MRRLITICIVIVLLLAVSSHADVIVSTLGSGNTYNTIIGWTIGYPGENRDQGELFSFTAPTSYFLDTIELAASHVEGINELDVWLMSDAAGEPGAIIEAFNFQNAMGPFGQNNPLLVGNSVLHPVLSPGTDYWLIVSAPNSDTWATWNWSSPAVSGTHAGRFGTGPWTISSVTTLGAFRVQGTVVPVPAAVLLGILGLGAAGLKLRKFA